MSRGKEVGVGHDVGQRPADVTVRSATSQDLEAVAQIYAHYVMTSTATFELEPPPPAEWRTRFAAVIGSGLPFLVAEAGDRTVGYGYCTPWRTRPAYRFTVEDSVYVREGATGRGIGRALLDALLDSCRRAGIREVIAVVTDGHPDSIALHRRCGFAEVGRLVSVGHKYDRWLDTVLLQRSLRS